MPPGPLEAAQIKLLQAQAAAVARAPEPRGEPLHLVINNAPPANTTTIENHVSPTPVTVTNTVEPTPVTVQNTLGATTVNVPAPVVNVTNDVQPAELNVLSLPARKTESTIEYDAAGNISKTTQIETDAP